GSDDLFTVLSHCLAPPNQPGKQTACRARCTLISVLPPFANEPPTDFAVEANRRAFEAALRLVESESGREWPLRIGGGAVTTGQWIEPTNPADPGRPVGRVARAGRDQAERALAAAERAFATWSRTDPPERARLLARVAAIMRRRKHELSAQMVVEIGKT